MSKIPPARVTYDQGREDQFREMMEQLDALRAKYKGVRGELLTKVRDAMAALQPAATTVSVAQAQEPLPPVADLIFRR
ncbi:MAG: hypothetical protein JNG84_14795 [Archangium sp.]|nr:hypothetical protein [Archangium sp.]